MKEELLKIPAQNKTRRNVIVKGYNGSAVIPAEDILYCKGDGSYTKIVKKDGTSVTASRPLIHFEEQLDGLSHFVRVHKSYIANINEIKFISKKETSEICFNNDICIPITNYKDVWDLLK
ncbi:LytR/AlgR family response regulator transcription factor [Niabella sp. CJ426]|uniref:LytR/AlgR family response regulator transcription factor n=1 Tax=Niabella sp. CJ426 TaxID=3393740 RepID=UPI003D032E3F